MDSKEPKLDELVSGKMPQHIAIIMDGNGRWAKLRGKPRAKGHRAGADAVRKVVTRARELNLEYLTLYAFSAQNWNRPKSEIVLLMSLLAEFCTKERKLLMDKDIRFRAIGDRDRLPKTTRWAVEMLEKDTRSNSAMQLIVAVSYGGREEITRAVKQIGREVAQGDLNPDEIDVEAIRSRFWSHDVPDPDLVIRTSGEMRLSNFLLWQIAYAEFVVDQTFWPDFDGDSLQTAIQDFQKRERRYGNISREEPLLVMSRDKQLG